MTCANGNDSSTTRDTGTNTARGIFEYYAFFWIVSKAVGRQKEWIRRWLSSLQSFVVGSNSDGRRNYAYTTHAAVGFDKVEVY
jgi:hypothetical protein